MEDKESVSSTSTPSSIPPPPLPLPPKLKYLTTIAILFGNITFGTSFNYFAPALDSIRVKYDSTIDEISIVFTIILVSYCFGALTCPLVYRYLCGRQRWVIFCLGGMGASLFATPFAPNQTTFYVMGGFLGFCVGTYDASQIVWMIEIWQSEAAPWIHAQRFSYAFGSILPPLIIAPFLSQKEEEEDNNYITTLRNDDWEEGNKLWIPFTIGGALSTAAFLFQLYLAILHPYYTPPMYAAEENASGEVNATPTTETTEIFQSKTDKVIKFLVSRRTKVILITGVFLGAYLGMEMTTMQFMPAFGQYSELRLSESGSAYVLTGVTGGYAGGRLVGILLSTLGVGPLTMLTGNLVLALGGNVMLLLWGGGSLAMLWVACVTLGLGFSTIIAAFSVWMEANLVFTNGVGSFMIVCGSVVATIYPLIVGGGVEQNAAVLTYVNFGSIGACGLALFAGWWVSGRGKVAQRS